MTGAPTGNPLAKERVLVFGLCLWTLGYVLLDRLDIGLTCLMMLATLLLLSRRHYAWSLAVLAAKSLRGSGGVPVTVRTSSLGREPCPFAIVSVRARSTSA